MKWKKLGRVFAPDNNYPWMQSHAANPVADHLYDDVFRVYFSSRDSQNISSISFVEFDLKQPDEILRLAEEPVIRPGEVGTFDDSGASMGCVTEIDGKKYIYYLGWNLGVTVPWRNSIGMAAYDPDKDSFIKVSQAPIMDRSDADPYSISYPYVLQDGDIYRMWYGSNLKWGPEQKDMAHLIKYAESKDGFNWQRDGKIAIDFQDDTEYAMSKPCVIKDDDCYRLWFSFRGESYRIAYAESKDAINWTRSDEIVGITVSDEGWDSETVEYPFVFNHKGERYMLYNGNSYGKTGFGLAILESL